MNRRGFTALFDASMVMILLGIAVSIIAVTVSSEQDYEIQEPGDVLEKVFYARLDTSYIGMEPQDRMAMNRMAYVSLTSHDGRFMDYMQDVLSAVYPWEGSYGMDVSWSGGSESIGISGGEPWRTSEKTFESGYADDMHITLRIYT